MKQIHHIYIAVFLLVGIVAKGQNPIGPQVAGITLAPFMTSTNKSVDASNSFFADSWNEGSLFINVDSKGLIFPQLKYDIAEDRILMKNEQGVFEFPKGSVLSFTLKAKDKKSGLMKEYTFISGIDGIEKYMVSNFFLAHYNSKKIKLITKHYAVLQNVPGATYGSKTQEYIYAKDEILYIHKDSKGIAVRKNKKSIVEALGGDKKMWEEYIKNNKLDMKKEEDIIALLKFYESKMP